MAPSLRIALLVNPFTLHAKGGHHAPELARELLGRGHTVRGFGAPPGTIPRSGSEPADGGPLDGDASVGLLGFEPDAVVAYDVLSPAAWLGARTARKLEAPLLLVEVGAKSDDGWRGRALGRIGETLWGTYVRRTTAAVVALDASGEERALKHGFPRRRISVLPAGVDLGVYRPGLTSGLILRHHIRGRILLYVGQLTHDRGLDVLIAAFANTVGQRADWSLVIAGEGKAAPALRASIDRLGIGACVHWLGRPRDEELPGLMSASTLLAVPAIDDSVRGRQLARAMACGVPVLASDLRNLALLVQDDQTGLLAPAGDVRAWTEMLRRASMSPDARQRWSRNARAVAEDRLGWPHVATKIESLLLAARGAPSPSPAAEPLPETS
ncbi:MAG: glycosyltransferase [Planctomycetota bacterium]